MSIKTNPARNIEAYMHGLDEKSVQIDKKLAGVHFKKCNSTLQSELSDETDRKFEGRASFITQIQTLARAIDLRTSDVSIDVTRKLRHVQPIRDSGMLYDAIKDYQELIEQARDHGISSGTDNMTMIGVIDDLCEQL